MKVPSARKSTCYLFISSCGRFPTTILSLVWIHCTPSLHFNIKCNIRPRKSHPSLTHSLYSIFNCLSVPLRCAEVAAVEMNKEIGMLVSVFFLTCYDTYNTDFLSDMFAHSRWQVQAWHIIRPTGHWSTIGTMHVHSTLKCQIRPMKTMMHTLISSRMFHKLSPSFSWSRSQIATERICSSSDNVQFLFWWKSIRSNIPSINFGILNRDVSRKVSKYGFLWSLTSNIALDVWSDPDLNPKIRRGPLEAVKFEFWGRNRVGLKIRTQRSEKSSFRYLKQFFQQRQIRSYEKGKVEFWVQIKG